MKKKLLAALILSLAMAAPQVNAAPTDLENAWNNTTDPNHKLYFLPNNGTVTIQEGLNFRDDDMFQINDFEHEPLEHYGSINGNGHSGFSMGGVTGIGIYNAKDIYGFNTTTSDSNPEGNGGAFNLTDDSYLEMDTWNHDGTTPLMTTIRNNTAAGKGGGIYQKGSWGSGVNFMNVSVKDNHAGAEGGGMYVNYSVSRIDALPGSTVEFRDNTAVIGGEEVANDIYLYTKPQEWVRGELKLFTSSKEEGSSTTEPSGQGVIYIGDMRAASYYDVKVASSKSDTTNGLVTIGRLWLDGTSSFDTSRVSKDSQTEINIGLLDMKGSSILNTVNNYIDNNLDIEYLYLDNSDNKFFVDADLANNKIDHFGSVSASGGTAKLNLNIISANTAGGSLKLFDAEDTNITITGGKTQYGDNSYAYSQAADKRYINYTVERSTTLQEALRDITVDSYDMPDLYVANSDLGMLYHYDPEPPYEFVPREFTVNGKGGVLMADGVAERAGISIPQQLYPPEDDNLTPHLIVKDLEAYSGFTRRATDVSAATGGAIWAEDSLLEVDNVTFTNNIATGTADAGINTFGLGGAIFVATRDGNYTGQDNFVSKINNSSFINNKSITYGTLGAAALVDGGGAVYSKGNLDITDSLFANNSAISNMRGYTAEGGALFVEHNSAEGGTNRDVNISGTMFMGNVAGDVLNNGELVNTAAYGGAIFATRVDMNIDDSSFINNTAHATQMTNEYTTIKGEAQGGAIHIDKLATAGPYAYNINNSTFAMNTAEAVKSVDNGDGTYTLTTDGVDQSQAFGGAIAIMRPIETTPKIDVNITGSDFYVNKAGSGGAIYNKGGLVNIKDSSFRSNVANHYYVDDNPRWNEDMMGGALYNGHTMTIDGSEFSSNYAKQITYDGDNPIVSTVKNDIRNDRELYFVGKASYLDGGIAGSGYTYFDLDEDQTMTIGANTSIVQTVIGVNSGAVNIVNGDTVTARSELSVGEDGLLNIESGAITINSKYNREIENSGTLLNGGTLDVSGAQYTGSVTNNADATLVNAGTIVAKTITNDGSFSNGVSITNPEELVPTATITGDFTNNYGLYNAGLMEGTLTNAGIFLNDGMVTSAITNAAEGVIANSGEILNGFTNNGNFANTIDGVIDTTGAVTETITNGADGMFINAGSVLASTITNTGTFLNGVNPENMDEAIPDAIVIANVTNSALMHNSGLIAGNLTNSAGTMSNDGVITGNITNNAGGYIYNYNDGMIIGDTIANQFSSNFENNGVIAANLTNSSSSNFVNNGAFSGAINNTVNANLINKGSIDASEGGINNVANITNSGVISGDIDNTNGNIANYVVNEAGQTVYGTIDGNIVKGNITTRLEDVTGTITINSFGERLTLLDNGITFDETNSDKIIGSGDAELVLKGDVISDATLENYTGDVVLTNGTKVIKGAGDAFQSANDLVVKGGNTATLSSLNGSGDALDYGNKLDVSGTGTLNLEMDWTDSLTGQDTTVFGDVLISKLDLTGVADGSVTTIINDTIKSKVKVEDIDLIISNGDANSVTYNSAAGTLTAVRDTLAHIVQTSDITSDEDAYYNYAMDSDESGSVTNSVIGNLKVNGNGHSIVNRGLVIGDIIDKGSVILKDTNVTGVSSIPGSAAILLNDESKLTIQADSNDVAITGTTGANKTAILMQTTPGGNASEVILEANNGHTITIDDDIISNDINNTVTFNNGTIKMNGVMDPLTAVNAGADVIRGGQDANVQWQLNGGTLTYLSDSYLNNPASLNSIEFKGGNLNLMNGAATTIALNDLKITGASNLYIDADLAAGTMDRFTNVSSTPATGTLSVAGINLLSDAKADKTTINFTSDANLQGSVNYTGSTALSRIFKYNVGYDNTTGDFEFNRMTGGGYSDYNPSVLAAPIAAQLGGYLTQLNSYDQAFMNMDTYMMMPSSVRTAMKMRNKIASLENAQYDDTKSMYDYAGGWFRPYATFETVALHNGPNVRNNMYGSFFGGESSLKDLGHGWDGMWGAYIGYNGSHQSYDGVGIYQNGGTLGLTGMAYKDNFFVGGTVNVGAAGAEASTMYGNDEFAMLMTGAALKTGYNWELANGKFIIQPSLMASYSFVNTFNYRNAAGVGIESDPLHAVTIEPGVKFIGNLKNGWQPYAGISMVFNIMDRTRFQANDVSLPNFSINPFVRYGIGVRKTWGERLTGHFQTYFTNGGRNGVGLSAGLRWAIGKQGSGEVKGQTPELKPTKITLNNHK